MLGRDLERRHDAGKLLPPSRKGDPKVAATTRSTSSPNHRSHNKDLSDLVAPEVPGDLLYRIKSFDRASPAEREVGGEIAPPADFIGKICRSEDPEKKISTRHALLAAYRGGHVREIQNARAAGASGRPVIKSRLPGVDRARRQKRVPDFEASAGSINSKLSRSGRKRLMR